MTLNWVFSIISSLVWVSHIYLNLKLFKSLASKGDIWICDYASDPTLIVRK